MNIDVLIPALVDRLGLLPEGTEISTIALVGAVYGYTLLPGGDYLVNGETLDIFAFLHLDDAFRKAAQDAGFVLDDAEQKNADAGMAFHIPYVVRQAKA